MPKVTPSLHDFEIYGIQQFLRAHQIHSGDKYFHFDQRTENEFSLCRPAVPLLRSLRPRRNTNDQISTNRKAVSRGLSPIAMMLTRTAGPYVSKTLRSIPGSGAKAIARN